MIRATRFPRFALIAVCVGLTACTPAVEPPGTHPALVSLASSSESPEFELGFWTEQAQDASSLWDKALSFCEAHADRPLPNCRLVTTAASARPALTFPIRRGGTRLLFRQPSVAEPYLPPEIPPINPAHEKDPEKTP